MYPYRSPYPVHDQRFIGFGLPLAIGGLSFLGGLLGGGLGASFAARPFYGGFGYPGFGYPGFGYPPIGYPPVGYPPMGFPGYY
ncbi:hypothetical protein QFZ87_001417 [Bacillus sp. SLBN-46]|jgi:hypothetical protein|uniref:hypothetical protein n=1 Tax=Bacillus sp. SLBN-46 TaxID=3042283 RepID=UPI002862C9DF|nr:hypothetical protein [Bacillus sp. SLBN-46]MDR6121820.1 hypothetical protein [Bacillus sp. SLBN-46]